MDLEILMYICIGFSFIAMAAAIAALLKKPQGVTKEAFEALHKEIGDELRASRTETVAAMGVSLQTFGEVQGNTQKQIAAIQDTRLRELVEQLAGQQKVLQGTVTDILRQVETRLTSMQQQNQKQLDAMRETVDEKLQKTLDSRISQSFSLVNERLEQVYKGLGEMQNLASGVGDLKKVLSNVKTRGILGEIQLGAILEQMLAPNQYEENVALRPGSTERVEFAVKLPGEAGGAPVYLPIDAKFPADTYMALQEAYENGTPDEIDAAGRMLENRIKGEAKDISQKYISPPYTTDFAIMFLPVEGLYAEVVRRGLIETLQNTYKVNIAGPTTMAALLNSLQMGFKTLAIQQRSGEVWQVLSAVKTEFNTFGEVLEAAQNRIAQTSNELDKLVGTRTRKIQSKLRNIEELPYSEAEVFLGIGED